MAGIIRLRSARPRTLRVWFWTVFLTLVIAAVAILPVPAVLRARSNSSVANNFADSLQAARQVIVSADQPSATPPAELAALAMPVLRLERAGQVLTAATQQYAFQASIASVLPAWPRPNCLSIRQNGYTLVGINDDQLLIPASVQKLLTAAALLEHLDLNERLTTRVLSNVRPVNGVLEGDIWVVGGGDPLLATESYADLHSRQPQLFTDVEDLTDALLAQGITSIRGRIVGDESRHDTVRYVESWPARYITQFNTGPLSALTVNDGLVTLGFAPLAATEPALEVVKLLGDLLLVRGVSLDVSYETGRAPANAVLLAEVKSPTVRQMIQQMLRESDNNTSEILLRELGLRVNGVGSTAAGAQVVTETTSDLLRQDRQQSSLPAPVVIDGSGLDRGNLVSCAQLTELLDYYGQDSIIGQGLPVAARSGTLSHRFRGHAAAGALTAKTGLLTGVNALAGFLETPTGTFTFSQIVNGVPRGSRIGIETQEELVETLLMHPVDCVYAQAQLAAAWRGDAQPESAPGPVANSPSTCGWFPPPEPEPEVELADDTVGPTAGEETVTGEETVADDESTDDETTTDASAETATDSETAAADPAS